MRLTDILMAYIVVYEDRFFPFFPFLEIEYSRW